ncbi:MAG: HD family phosphohydrolase, partial [Deltaproteobacteria bacterium]|nr:HDIG domain-containing protein [Candidatus Deferrimicrobiaceae bacterium]
NVMKNGDKAPRPAEGAARRRTWSVREVSIGLLSAAVFAVLFYLWGGELNPLAAGRLGGIFPLVGAVALTLAVALFLTEWFRFAGREVRKVRLAARDFLFLCTLSFALFFLAKGVVEVLPEVPSWHRALPARLFVYLIPLPAFAMIVRILLNSEVAILFTVAASVLSAAAASGRWPALLFLLLCGTAAAARSGRIQDRYRMLLAGVYTAPVCALGAVALELAFHGTGGIWWAGLLAGINGLIAAPIALAVLPMAEYAFGYASDIRLMELASTAHPLLKRLMLEAPGTFHHSVVVGTLAEAGAAAIHANPLLCRVAALFHDIGKVGKPQYFSENQAGKGNVHDVLSPGMSRVIILSHVKEGLRLAREYRLGDRIAEIIEQHHGTSLMYCFLDKAQTLIQERRVSEESFRYPGPRPRSREAAIIMLADSAEAAAGSLKNPTPAELDDLVTRIVNRAYLDGQLNECDMTLRDLHAVGQSFTRVLTAVAHARVEYPESGKGPFTAGLVP